MILSSCSPWSTICRSGNTGGGDVGPQQARRRPERVPSCRHWVPGPVPCPRAPASRQWVCSAETRRAPPAPTVVTGRMQRQWQTADGWKAIQACCGDAAALPNVPATAAAGNPLHNKLACISTSTSSGSWSGPAGRGVRRGDAPATRASKLTPHGHQLQCPFPAPGARLQ